MSKQSDWGGPCDSHVTNGWLIVLTHLHNQNLDEIGRRFQAGVELIHLTSLTWAMTGVHFSAAPNPAAAAPAI